MKSVKEVKLINSDKACASCKNSFSRVSPLVQVMKGCLGHVEVTDHSTFVTAMLHFAVFLANSWTISQSALVKLHQKETLPLTRFYTKSTSTV